MAVSAFPGHPVVYFAIVLGPVVELPMLLLISRLMLDLRSRRRKLYLRLPRPAERSSYDGVSRAAHHHMKESNDANS